MFHATAILNRPLGSHVQARRAAFVLSRRAALRGFSLVELVVVLAIISIFSSFAIFRYIGAAQRYSADLAARRLAADLELARTRARSSARPVEVRFSGANDGYAIINEPGLDNPAANYTVDLTRAPYSALLGSISIADARRSIFFDGHGAPIAGARLEIIVGEQRRAVMLEPSSGRVSIETP